MIVRNSFYDCHAYAISLRSTAKGFLGIFAQFPFFLSSLRAIHLFKGFWKSHGLSPGLSY